MGAGELDDFPFMIEMIGQKDTVGIRVELDRTAMLLDMTMPFLHFSTASSGLKSAYWLRTKARFSVFDSQFFLC